MLLIEAAIALPRAATIHFTRRCRRGEKLKKKAKKKESHREINPAMHSCETKHGCKVRFNALSLRYCITRWQSNTMQRCCTHVHQRNRPCQRAIPAACYQGCVRELLSNPIYFARSHCEHSRYFA